MMKKILLTILVFGMSLFISSMVFAAPNHGDIAVATSPDGECIASGDMDGTVTIWDASSGDKKVTFKKHAGPSASMAFRRMLRKRFFQFLHACC